MASVSMTVNGQAVTRDVEPRTLLVEFLRQHLDLTGTHVGCDTSQCGACVVHVDGAVGEELHHARRCRPRAAKITTIEGLAKNGELHPMQAAFREHHALQCGFCTPGMIMSAIDLLKRKPDPSEQEIREWLEGNLCRCTGYHNIVKAIQAAAGGHEELMPWPATGSALRSSARRTTASSPAAARTPTTSTGRGRSTPISSARRTPTPGSTASTRAGPRRRRACSRCSTGADVAAAKWGGLICGWMVKSRDGSDMKAGPHPILAQGKVRYVGDHVALVVAETYHQAKDAAELVEVDYDVLPACVATAHARDRGQPQVHDEIARNTVYEWELGDHAAVDQAIASAAHVTTVELVNNRLVPNAIEPRAAIGEYDRAADGFTLYTTSQNPHVARLVIAAFVGVAPEHKLRVIAPDVGGGFGSKIFIYAEECACLLRLEEARPAGQVDRGAQRELPLRRSRP